MAGGWRQHTTWFQAVVLAALPWAQVVAPWWVPALIALSALALRQGRESSRFDELAFAGVALSALAHLVAIAGWQIVALWSGIGALVVLIGRFGPATSFAGLRVTTIVAASGWAVVFLVRPDLIGVESGGWVTPAVLLLAAVRLGGDVAPVSQRRTEWPMPPAREVRGTLSLRNVVLSDGDGLPASVPIELELRAGESLAILYDDVKDAENLVRTLGGRSAPHAGQIMLDGNPLEPGEALVAVVAEGESFLVGDLESNLAALCEAPLGQSESTAVIEACGLGPIVDELGSRSLEIDGSPLERIDRLLLLTARIIPSHYRVMIVSDPSLWTSSQLRERWRQALVRSSVGRTAIWLTRDPDLAQRASQALVLENGALRGLTAVGRGGEQEWLRS